MKVLLTHAARPRGTTWYAAVFFGHLHRVIAERLVRDLLIAELHASRRTS